MPSEKDYLRLKRYRMKHAEQIRAKHDAWIDSHRRQWNAYLRDYKFRRKLGLPGGKKHREDEKPC